MSFTREATHNVLSQIATGGDFTLSGGKFCGGEFVGVANRPDANPSPSMTT